MHFRRIRGASKKATRRTRYDRLSRSTRYPTRDRWLAPVLKGLSRTSVSDLDLVSPCVSISVPLDTEEVAGSNPVVPTIFINGLHLPKPFNLTQCFTQSY
jgi:hypothetical protein